MSVFSSMGMPVCSSRNSNEVFFITYASCGPLIPVVPDGCFSSNANTEIFGRAL